MNFSEQIPFEILTEEQRELIEIIGIEKFIELSQFYSGSFVYIPKFDTLTKSTRNDEIRESFTGYNIRQLAQKHHLSESMIRKIVKPKQPEIKKQIENHPDQLTFWNDPEDKN